MRRKRGDALARQAAMAGPMRMLVKTSCRPRFVFGARSTNVSCTFSFKPVVREAGVGVGTIIEVVSTNARHAAVKFTRLPAATPQSWAPEAELPTLRAMRQAFTHSFTRFLRCRRRLEQSWWRCGPARNPAAGRQCLSADLLSGGRQEPAAVLARLGLRPQGLRPRAPPAAAQPGPARGQPTRSPQSISMKRSAGTGRLYRKPW